jgi:glycosyltransferase involved in cell wall biosynthesis
MPDFARFETEGRGEAGELFATLRWMRASLPSGPPLAERLATEALDRGATFAGNSEKGRRIMKILMVVHQFLPRHVAGSEIYTYRLVQALRARGHDVQLFFTEIHPDRPQYELRRGTFDGIPYFEAVHNHSFASFRHTYCDPAMEELFRQVLEPTQPDVLHVQHLHLHSIGYIDIARQRGIPILYTLHEYMLMCLAGGLLLRPGPTLCDGPQPAACARCAQLTYHCPPQAASWLPAALQRLTGLVRHKLGIAASNGGAAGYVKAVQRRRDEIVAALDGVNLFVAPSRFLRQRFIDDGMIRPERIVHSDYGFFTTPFVCTRRPAPATLRVGYVGTISEYKGVHLVVDAFREIETPGMECRIYGDLDTFPDYKRRLLEKPTPPAVRYMGRVANDRVAEVLAELDVLVVPSLWPENSPLTIHEAYLAKVPVVTSNCGGMAELVVHDKTGLHFRTGDAADLRRQLLRLRHEDGLLESMRRHFPPVKTIEDDAIDTENRYRLLLRGEKRVS